MQDEISHLEKSQMGKRRARKNFEIVYTLFIRDFSANSHLLVREIWLVGVYVSTCELHLWWAKACPRGRRQNHEQLHVLSGLGQALQGEISTWTGNSRYLPQTRASEANLKGSGQWEWFSLSNHTHLPQRESSGFVTVTENSGRGRKHRRTIAVKSRYARFDSEPRPISVHAGSV